MDLLITLGTSIVILLGALVQGIAGFGNAQVIMGLLPLFRNAAAASVIYTATAVVCNGRVFWSVKEDFEFDEWIVPIIGLIFGMPLGIFVFQNLSENQLRLIIGFVLLIAVALIILIRQTDVVSDWIKENKLKPGWKTGVLVGFLAGLLGGAVAIPGPPMILYGAFMIANEYWSGARMKAIFTAFFGTVMAYRLAILILTESVTQALATEALIVLPALFIGAWIGIKIYRHIPEKIFRWVVIVGLTINAIILTVTSL